MRRLVPIVVLLAVITVAVSTYSYVIYVKKPMVWIPDPFNRYNITSNSISMVASGNITLRAVVAKLLDYGNTSQTFRIFERSTCANVTTILRLCGVASQSGTVNVTVCINSTCITLLNSTTMRVGNTTLSIGRVVYVGHGYSAYLIENGPEIGYAHGNATLSLVLRYYTHSIVYAVVCVDLNVTIREAPCNITLLFK